MLGDGFSEEYIIFVIKKFEGMDANAIGEILFEPDRAK